MQTQAKFFTIAQAAGVLKISPDTLRRWEKKGLISPLRTKGGIRKYTLLDLKIAKLNKRKTRFRLPALLKQNYPGWKQSVTVALTTSLVWILGIVLYQKLTPIFLSPFNPEQQILSDEIKKQINLSLASELGTNQVSVVKVLVLPDQPPFLNRVSGLPILRPADTLILRSANTPILQYSDTPNYFSLQPLLLGIPTVIKRI